MQLRLLASALTQYAKDHCDTLPESIAEFPEDDFTDESYLLTANRSHLLAFERPGLWVDHTVSYIDVELSGKWESGAADTEAWKVTHVPEQQFAQVAANLAHQSRTSSPIDGLVSAAEKGDAEKVQPLLDLGISVNDESHEGWTALTTAAQEGQSAIVDLLSARGAKIDQPDDFGIGRTALMRACALGHADVVDSLLAHHADVRAKRDEGSNALTDAMPYPAIVSKLLHAGADGNEMIRKEWSPLIAACTGGHAESALLLIEHGADLKRDGVLALDASATNGHAGVIDTLLSAGVTTDKNVLGQCLISAYAHPEAMKKLISAGADLNARCKCASGRTTLMISALNNCPEAVDFLIAAGADVNAKDDNGHTALDLMLADTRPQWLPRNISEKNQLLAIVETLRRAGAKESGLYVEWPEPR